MAESRKLSHFQVKDNNWASKNFETFSRNSKRYENRKIPGNFQNFPKNPQNFPKFSPQKNPSQI